MNPHPTAVRGRSQEEHRQRHLDQDKRAGRGARTQANLCQQVHGVCALPALRRLERATGWSTRVERRALMGIPVSSCGKSLLARVGRERYRVIGGRVTWGGHEERGAVTEEVRSPGWVVGR
jgi:hypothetical protein